jgi:hypothetical protein
MDIILILGVIWLLGWFVLPMLYGIFIKLPKQYMDGEFTKPKQEDKNEIKADNEDEETKDNYLNTLKQNAKALTGDKDSNE